MRPNTLRRADIPAGLAAAGVPATSKVISHHGAWPDRKAKRRRPAGPNWPAIVTGCMIGIAGLWGIAWSVAHLGAAGESAQAAGFAETVMAAAAKDGERRHPFGGRLSSKAGVVVAKGVPSDVCASAGWVLAKNGILAVNGVIPARGSTLVLTQLCRATERVDLQWMPREPAAPPAGGR